MDDLKKILNCIRSLEVYTGNNPEHTHYIHLVKWRLKLKQYEIAMQALAAGKTVPLAWLEDKLASTPEASCTEPCRPVMKEEEGNNPMSRFDECYAAPKSAVTAGAMAITVQAPAVPSDEMTQRKFLLEEFSKFDRYEWQAGSATSALRKLFNLDAPKYPATSQALLDAFKSGAFEVDQAKVDKNAKVYELDAEDRYDDEDDFVGERFYGIKFTGLPVPDQKGFDAAKAALEALKVDTKRTIMVGSPADGLAALKALEAWTPTGPTVH